MMLQTYRCEWAIEVEADSPLAAARQAAMIAGEQPLAGDGAGSWLVINEDERKAKIVDLAEQEPTIAERYVSTRGTLCPSCKSPNIEGGKAEADGPKATCPAECGDCGAIWTDVYTLTNMVDLAVRH